MRRCIELARLGVGHVSPNPMVGSVLVHDGKIVSEGYHAIYGGPHAEAVVIRQVLEKYGDNAADIFKSSTLYVSLEPCAHQGKTPPCADLIIKHGIPRVVIGCRDAFAQVDGKGISKLRDAGVDVLVGILEAEAQSLNRRFFTRIKQGRPYIILKWAQTADGYFAPADGLQQWISGREAKQLAHRWRSEEDAVLVGTKTALIDNPQLTVREWSGRNPKRILIDRNLAVPESHAIFDDSAETIIFNEVKDDWQENRKYITLEHSGLYLPQLVSYQLHLMDVQSLVVEGGATILGQFINAGLWDEARVFTSPTTWGAGIEAPRLHKKAVSSHKVGKDRLDIYVKE